jgi:PAS domain S-box-containing protein
MYKAGRRIATQFSLRHARHGKWYLAEHWTGPEHVSAVRMVVATVAAVAIFAVDTVTPLSSAVAVLYIIPLLIVGHARAGGRIIHAAVVALILTLVSFGITHGPGLDTAAILRLLFSLAAIVTTAFLLRQQAEAHHLHRVQARLLDVTADAIILRTPEGEVLLWNQGAENLYGWARAAVLGRSHHPLLHSAFAESADAVELALATTGRWEGEVEQERADGSQLIVNSRWQVQYDAMGNAWAVLETNSDMTAWRRAERAVRDGEARYRGIFETQAVAVLEYDFVAVKRALEALRNGGVNDLRAYFETHRGFLDRIREEVRIVDANATALKLFGVATKPAFFCRYDRLMPANRTDFVDCLLALDAGDGIFQRRAMFKTDGGDVTVIIGFSFPPGCDGLDRVPVSLIDLTETETVAREMARMRSDLDRAMRLATVSEVSASIAHEMNQPLAAIRTFAEGARRWLAREPMNVAEARAAIEDVIMSAESAGNVISRARKAFGRAQVERCPVVVDELVADALRMAMREIDESGALLTMDLQATGATILGDRLLLQQTILNFTMNALQAMAPMHGERHLRVASRTDGSVATVILRDTGPGIPSEILERGMEAFAGGMPERSSLGLAVCRSTISSHGGTIEFDNGPEKGAVIKVVLPLSDAVA